MLSTRQHKPLNEREGTIMTKMQFSIIGDADDGQNITVFVPGQSPLAAHSTHPNWDKIVAGALAKDDSITELFDVSKTAGDRFLRLTDRVTAANGRLYLDGDEVANALAEQVVRFLDEDVEDWKPLVKFFEKAQQNPQEHSREQLYPWLAKRPFTITDEGDILAYKGVRLDGDSFKSISTGKAIVDGEVKSGHIPNHIGAIVEMPRSEVQHDPAVGCHTGLHVGTYEFANGFAQGALLEVHVNPRDVVSVPTECDWQKMRVCRYTVVDTIDAPHTAPVKFSEDYDEYDEYYDDDGGYLGEWGDGEEDDNLDLDDDELLRAAEQLGIDLRPEPASQDRPAAIVIAGVSSPVNPGDKFEDLDKRRTRVLTVEDIFGSRAKYSSSSGSTGEIEVGRLLIPYRFKRL
jgi:hypothetical protein